jgi:hypothetical protein
MEKNVIKWSYWLGVICSVIAVLTRACGLIGLNPSAFPHIGSEIVYQRFVDRAFFFFIISIATATYMRSRKAAAHD